MLKQSAFTKYWPDFVLCVDDGASRMLVTAPLSGDILGCSRTASSVSLLHVCFLADGLELQLCKLHSDLCDYDRHDMFNM